MEEQVIANRLWRIEWMRFRWMVEALHNKRRMFGGYGYLYEVNDATPGC
jgi:hypothetical protein